MKSNGDEGSSTPYPKRSKPSNDVQSFSTSTSMQDSIPFLPQELITEILSRLHVKILLKFSCVSKSWLSLISSPYFVKIHLSKCSNNKDFTHHGLMLRPFQPIGSLKYCSLRSLLYDSVLVAFDLDYPMKQLDKSFSIVGSVDGLICFSIEEQHNFLWNPSIRMFKKLPYSRSTLRSKYFLVYGFGYDEIQDDYKVVGITSSYYNGPRHVKIYSMNSHCWRSTDDFQGGLLFNKSGVFLNGKLHWATYIRDNFEQKGQAFISVNLADGKYGRVEHPCGEGEFELMLGVLGSDLFVVRNNWKIHADVWFMKECGVKESWIEMLTINLPDNYPLSPHFGMSNKSQILFEVGSTLMIYNVMDGSMRYLNITSCATVQEADIYIESLVLPFRLKRTRMQQKRGLKKLS